MRNRWIRSNGKDFVANIRTWLRYGKSSYCNLLFQREQQSRNEHFHRLICPLRRWPDRQDLFRDDVVAPFDERNENGRIAELGGPIRKIAFRDPTGPGTSSSSKYSNVLGDDLLAQLAERRPTNG